MDRFPRLYAVGDIHGHYDQLILLLGQFLDDGMDPTQDTVVFLGDYIDGGPDSAAVVEYLRDSQKRFPHWVFLAGNHEHMLLDWWDDQANGNLFYLWYGQGGKATTDSYRRSYTFPRGQEGPNELQRALLEPGEAILSADVRWMRGLRLTYQTEKYVFVHAGLAPGLSLEDALKPSQRETHLWIRQPFLRSAWDWGKCVVFGHTAFTKAKVMKNKIGIDCMFHDKGKLCGVELTGKPKFFYADSEDHLTEEKMREVWLALAVPGLSPQA